MKIGKFIAGVGIGTVIGMLSVSYTHLDVYKRQCFNRHFTSSK